MRSLLVALSLLLPALSAAQPYLNLDFGTVTRNRLRGWTVNSAGYELAPDTATFVSGLRSARIRNTGAPETGLGPTAVALPLNPVRGRQLKISGHIRTDSVSGYVAVWLRADGLAGTLSLDNMATSGPRGTTDWTMYEYERMIDPAAVNVVFGFFLQGRGTAWFDDLRITVDGVPIPQGAAPFTGEPSNEQIEWLRSNAIPFSTDNAGSGFEDLRPLRQVIGNARIVGLGEATHGTAEFFRMKHRLVEWLATEHGFTIFSIEANMPESYG